MGVVPATIAVLDGQLKAGLTDDELVRIASEDIPKLSVRDLPIALARSGSGATTVAATSYIANLAGIRVFATGGLGGVHRGASETFDESADLTVLSEVPITVVSAGVKSILDIPATLERLESLSVIVLGYGTDKFPSFWLTDSGEQLDWSVPDAAGGRRRHGIARRAGPERSDPGRQPAAGVRAARSGRARQGADRGAAAWPMSRGSRARRSPRSCC